MENGNFSEKEVKQNLAQTEQALKDAKALINVLKQAGEPTAELDERFRKLESKRNKWMNAIKLAGY